MKDSQKTDKIKRFLTSPEGDPVRGIQEPARYIFRVLSTWAEGTFGAEPRVHFLESSPTEKVIQIKLFFTLLGENHLQRGTDCLTLPAGDLGVVLGGNGHGEHWEPDQSGHYLQIFVGLPPGRLSMNLAGNEKSQERHSSPRILAGASLAHSESTLLEQMIRYLLKHPESASSLMPAWVNILQTGVSLHQLRGHSSLVRRAIRRLMENPCHPDVSVQWMAGRLGCHPDTLSRRFHAETGRPFLTAVRDVRMQIAVDLLADGSLPVAEVAGLCGYRDHSYFTRVFRDTHGTAPSRYHRRTT